MHLKRLWEEKINWLLFLWLGYSLIFRPGWLIFSAGVLLWVFLLYFTTPGVFWNLIAMLKTNRDQSEDLITKALSFQPATPKPYINLALIKAKKKKWDEAVTLLEQANNKPGRPLPPRLKIVWAICYREAGEYGKAIELCQALLKENYINSQVYFNLAFTHFKAGALEEALKAAEKARALNVNETEPVILIGRIHFAMKDYQAAKNDYEWSITHTSWPVESYYWLGRSELELGEINQAISNLKTAVQRITDDPLLSDVPMEEAQQWLDKALTLKLQES